MTLDSNKTPFPCTHCLCPNFFLWKLAGRFPIRTPEAMRRCLESHRQHIREGGSKAQGKKDFLDKTSIRPHSVSNSRVYPLQYFVQKQQKQHKNIFDRTSSGISLAATFTCSCSQTFSTNFSWESSQESLVTCWCTSPCKLTPKKTSSISIISFPVSRIMVKWK